jgi:hypothetical protein
LTESKSAFARRASVLSRVIRPDRNDLPPGAARAILKLDFDPVDLARMHDLAVKNQEGGLTEEERADLADYRQAGLVLDLLKSKARLSLRRARTGG